MNAYNEILHKSNNKAARIAGVLFITASVAAIIGYVSLLDPILTAPDYLASISANENEVLIGMLFTLTNSAVIIGIPVILFPVLRKHNETLAVGYLAARIIEGAVFAIGIISLLSLVTMSHEFVNASVPDISRYQIIGTTLLAVYDWTFWLAVTLILGLTALILNFALYQSRLVPRWISVWGIISGGLVFAQGLLEIWGFSQDALSISIALQEMVLAVWLIAKGFNAEPKM